MVAMDLSSRSYLTAHKNRNFEFFRSFYNFLLFINVWYEHYMYIPSGFTF